MSNIRQILEMERHNDGHIRLYRIDRYWLAFERSAFNLFSVCNVENVVKIRDTEEERNSMLIAVVEYGTHAIYNPQFTILEMSEDEALISCRAICRGFEHWKESLISSTNIHHLNLDTLLN